MSSIFTGIQYSKVMWYVGFVCREPYVKMYAWLQDPHCITKLLNQSNELSRRARRARVAPSDGSLTGALEVATSQSLEFALQPGANSPPVSLQQPRANSLSRTDSRVSTSSPYPMDSSSEVGAAGVAAPLPSQVFSQNANSGSNPQQIKGFPLSNGSQAAAGQMRHHKSSKRPRVIFSEEQKRVLEAAFEEQQYPPQERLDSIASAIAVPVRTVVNWFHNHRVRSKHRPSQMHDSAANSVLSDSSKAFGIGASGSAPGTPLATGSELEQGSVSSSAELLIAETPSAVEEEDDDEDSSAPAPMPAAPELTTTFRANVVPASIQSTLIANLVQQLVAAGPKAIPLVNQLVSPSGSSSSVDLSAGNTSWTASVSNAGGSRRKRSRPQSVRAGDPVPELADGNEDSAVGEEHSAVLLNASIN